MFLVWRASLFELRPAAYIATSLASERSVEEKRASDDEAARKATC
jgi:hypothetical protein